MNAVKSPYQVLGVPGNASAVDIEEAFQKSRRLYPPERLASDDTALDRFNEVKAAYDILRNADFRAALDRKLAAARPVPAARTVVVTEREGSTVRTALLVGVALVALLFGGGAYVSAKNAQVRREQAAMEEERRKADAAQAERQRVADAQAERDRERAKQQQDNAERRQSYEAQAAGARAAANIRSAEYVQQQTIRSEAADAQRREAEAQAQDRRNTYEAQARLARDKQRIRELCLQQYRRPDC